MKEITIRKMLNQVELGKVVKAYPKSMMDLLFSKPQPFVGKIIATSPASTEENQVVFFATPHGSIMELTLADLQEADINDNELLADLEAQATGEEKLLYGYIDTTKKPVEVDGVPVVHDPAVAIAETLKYQTIKKDS